MPKKKFIDRKNAVTFRLIHRSQQDPLVADENAPQRVLVPEKKTTDNQLEEQQKYGIYFDDDYNYLQHLHETGTSMDWERVESTKKPKDAKPNLNLPSSVFASAVEEDVGLLNKAAPESGLRLDLDPDIVAAMDDDYNYEDPANELEDNFMELANAECSDEEEEYNSSNYGSEENDEVGSLNGSQYSFNKEETKSKFSEYSMSSSVIRRNEQLTLLDRKFEVIMASYGDEDIGALDGEEIEGNASLNSDVFLQYVKEFDEKQSEKYHLEDLNKKANVPDQYKYVTDDATNSDEEYDYIEIPEKPAYDCESKPEIYSTIPKLIEPPTVKTPKIKINPRTGMPMNVFKSNKLTAKALKALNDEYDAQRLEILKDGYILNNTIPRAPESIGGESLRSALSALSIRPKDETSEERRERKKLLREHMQLRRMEKKANKLAFKEFSKRLVKMKINNQNNVQGNRIT